MVGQFERSPEARVPSFQGGAKLLKPETQNPPPLKTLNPEPRYKISSSGEASEDVYRVGNCKSRLSAQKLLEIF